MKNYKSEAIVIGKKEIGEADKIYIVFSKNHGKIRLLARGVRLAKSRKRGSLEVFNKVQLEISRGKGIDVVNEVEVLRENYNWKKNLRRLAVAYNLVEVVDRVTLEDVEQKEVYTLLSNSLLRLEEEKDLKGLRSYFTKSILTLLGFWPRDKELVNPDSVLEDVVERKLSTIRVGKRILS